MRTSLSSPTSTADLFAAVQWRLKLPGNITAILSCVYSVLRGDWNGWYRGLWPHNVNSAGSLNAAHLYAPAVTLVIEIDVWFRKQPPKELFKSEHSS